MASLIRNLVDCLDRDAVTQLGEAVGYQFRRGSRDKQICRSYGQRFGRDAALEEAIKNLATADLVEALSVNEYSTFLEEGDAYVFRDYATRELEEHLTPGEVRQLAVEVFSASSDAELGEVVERWPRCFELLDEERVARDEDGAAQAGKIGANDGDEDEDEEDYEYDHWALEQEVRDRESFVQKLREEPEGRVRGFSWRLPEVAAADLQPLMAHQARTLDRFQRNKGCSGIIHLPTGSGKTRVALELMARWLEDPNARVIWATKHTSLIRQSMIRLVELLERFPRRLRVQWLQDLAQATDPELFDYSDVVYATQDTLRKWLVASTDGRRPREPLSSALTDRRGASSRKLLLIYDECHELGANGLQQAWRKFDEKVLSRAGARARLVVAGLSATPMPTNPKAHQLLQELIFPVPPGTESAKDWGVLVHHSESMRSLTEAKILCPINLRLQKSRRFDIPDAILRSATDAGMKRFPRSMGARTEREWAQEFSRLFNKNVMSHRDVLGFLCERIGDELQTLGKTVVFCATIGAANHMVDLLRRNPKVGAGRVTLVHSRMEDAEIAELDEGYTVGSNRKELQIKEFVDRKSDPCVMVNVGMLTTGFDDPKISTVLFARLTFSKNLFWQMIGRGLRGPHVGGTPHCHVIDPIRLTEQFAVFDGYRPDLLEGGIPARDLEGDRGSFLSPGELAPLLDASEIPPPLDVAFDSEIRVGVQQALRAFLAGKAFDTAEIVAAMDEVQVDSSGLVPKLVPAREERSPASVIAMFETRIKGLEAECGWDLAWLHAQIPPVLTEAATKMFLRSLQAVEEHGIENIEHWHEYVASRL